MSLCFVMDSRRDGPARPGRHYDASQKYSQRQVLLDRELTIEYLLRQ